MKPIERVEKLIKDKGLSVSAFENTVGVSNASIGIAIKRNSNLRDDTLNSILNAFPEISPEWLLTGKGPMLREGSKNSNDRAPVPEAGEPRIDDLIARKVEALLAPRFEVYDKATDLLAASMSRMELDLDEIKDRIQETHDDVIKLK